jgi:hypothetical protein
MKFIFKKLLLVSIFVVVLNQVGFAMMFVPDIYGSVGVMNSSSKRTYYSDVSTTNLSNYQVSLGIRPLDVPILGGLRLEAQYNSGNSSNLYSAVLYYDILRIIPFVNPYIGVGMIASKLNSDVYSSLGVSDSDNALSYHIGLDFVLPITGLNLFLELREMKFDYGQAVNSLSNLKIQKIDTIFGIKYYFLK